MPTVITPFEVARAWHGIKGEWIVRRNKMRPLRQWEVVHDWGGDVVSDETMKVVGCYTTQSGAEKYAERLEDTARGSAVLALIKGK